MALNLGRLQPHLEGIYEHTRMSAYANGGNSVARVFKSTQDREEIYRIYYADRPPTENGGRCD